MRFFLTVSAKLMGFNIEIKIVISDIDKAELMIYN